LQSFYRRDISEGIHRYGPDRVVPRRLRSSAAAGGGSGSGRGGRRLGVAGTAKVLGNARRVSGKWGVVTRKLRQDRAQKGVARMLHELLATCDT